MVLVVFSGHNLTAQVVRGYTGTQTFANCGNPDPEITVCRVNDAGAAVWLSFIADATGVLYLNTDGSSFDTVMGVYTRSPSNPTLLIERACDDNGGLDGRDSALHLPVQAGTTYQILMAGVSGACGTLRFTYRLVAPSRLAVLARTPAGEFQGRVSGYTNMRFTIQASTNLTNWAALLTTNSTNTTFDFVDRSLPRPPRRFYRAVMLP